MKLTNSEFEVIEGVFVDNIQLSHQSKCKLYHGPNVHVLPVMFLVKNTTNNIFISSQMVMTLCQLEKAMRGLCV